MSVSTEDHPVDAAAAASASLLADARASDLPASLHVLFDIGLADDCAQVRAALVALVSFQSVTGVRVRLGTAGGPTCLGRLDHDRLELVASHLGVCARGFHGDAILSAAIARTGQRHPRLARLVRKRPLLVLVTSRSPADPIATARALSRSARAGAPWLVVTTTPGIGEAAFRNAAAAAPDGVSVARVSDLRDGPDTLIREILRACARFAGGR
jgi:hypothetical protein